MNHKVFIMRGIPGSGKSRYVAMKTKEIDEKLPIDVQIVSADHYFLTECEHDSQYKVTGSSYEKRLYEQHVPQCTSGAIYKFDASKLGKAHQTCQDRFMRLIGSETPYFIFVDNTNTTIREMEFYVKACIANSLEFVIVNVIADVEVAAARNAHSVPADKVRQMHARLVNATKDIPLDWPVENFYSGG